MEQTKVSLIAGVIVLMLAAIALYFVMTREERAAVNGYKDCVRAGGIVALSYPSQCRMPDGRRFTQEVPPEDRSVVPPLDEPETSPPLMPSGSIKSYDECVAAGYPATLSYPSTCRTPDGQLFTEQPG